MKANIGNIDRIFRLVLGFGLLSLYFILEGQIKYLSLIGFIPIATAILRFCPLYKVLGIKTCH
ncbi:MAG: DUF2892 domain-containing protein [Bdellovibrionales bacterium]|nr:DUF2892 domain-containing protein [Bdellovibrionales bacterium]